MAQPSLDFRGVNALWGSVLVETLVRCGLRQAVVSPGSRSTPLALALARHPGIEAIPVLDERSAAFFGLGLARRAQHPVVLVCTSGTAAANYLPAIIEAAESGVPLLVLTADRPAELRDCASGQAIDQQKLYGRYTVFHHEMALPGASEPLLRYLRQTAAHALLRTLSPYPGPVHLNAPFRDPLAPVDGGGVGPMEGAIDWGEFFAACAPVATPVAAAPPIVLDEGGPGVIVAGPAQPADPAGYAAAVGRIARKLGWPVLADALSPVRQHAAEIPGVVTAYDSILRDPAAAALLRPRRVLCLDGWPTSKVLRTWLQEADPRVWMASTRPDNRDGLHCRTRMLPVSVPSLAGALAPEPPVAADPWAAREARAREAIDGALGAEPALFEPKAAWLLARRLPAGTPVFIASSMPARDVEYVWPAGNRGLRPFFNRGANGIDGTLSTALGMAHGGPPSVLLTGDLALLHDSNGFLLGPRFAGSLTIVLINNHGGGIFEHLPVSRLEPPFEDFFATPQRVDFARLAAAHGIPHVAVRDWGHFEGLVAELPAAGIRVIEVPTDRKRDAAGRRELFAAAARGK